MRVECHYFQLRLQLVLLQAPCILIAASQLASLLEFRMLHGMSYCDGAMLMTFRIRLLVCTLLFRYIQIFELKKLSEVPLLCCFAFIPLFDSAIIPVSVTKNCVLLLRGIKAALEVPRPHH